MHAPLFEQKLFKKSIDFWHDGTAYLLGCDYEHTKNYPAFGIAQRPSESTIEFADYVNSEIQIKAVIAGHVHFNSESLLPGGKMQYVTACSSKGFAREITFT